MRRDAGECGPRSVAPFAGAWIETVAAGADEVRRRVAPSRGRGLKLRREPPAVDLPPRRPPHGGVD